MKIVLNGEPIDVDARTLGELCRMQGYGGAKIATAVNGQFVPERARATTRLSKTDHVEIVAPRQGG